MLDTLRSLNSRYLANTVRDTEYKMEFHDKLADWNLSKPTDVTILTKMYNARTKDYNAEFKQQLKQSGKLDEINRMIEDEAKAVEGGEKI
jgi:hypothetical protein